MTAEHAIAAAQRADAADLAEHLIGLPEKQRRSLYPELRRITDSHIRRGPRQESDQPWMITGQVVVFGAGTSRNVRNDSWWYSWVGPYERLVDVVAARPQNIISAMANAILADDWNTYWFVVRDLVRAGHLAHPDSEPYYVGLVRSLPRVFAMSRPNLDMMTRAVVSEVTGDPVLGDELWRAMEFEEAINWMGATYSSWADYLVALVEAGLLDRDRMLDTALAGQLRDLRPSSSSFFRRVFEALHPSSAEVADRSALLIRIVGAGRPSEQRAAADALRKLAEAGVELDGHAIASAVTTPLAGTQKGAAVAALRLLAAASLDDETRGRAALNALGHRHADVQARALRMLEAVAPDAKSALGAEALLWADSVAPEHREALQMLTGMTLPEREIPSLDVAELEQRAEALPREIDHVLSVSSAYQRARDGAMPTPVRFDPAAAPSFAPAVEPITEAASLVETLVVIVAGSGDAVDVERAIDGLARIDPHDVDERTRSPLRPLVKDVLNPEWQVWSAAGAFTLAAWNWWARTPPPPLPYLRAPGRLRRRRSAMPTLTEPPRAPDRWWATAFDGSAYVAGVLGFLVARLHEAVTLGLSAPRPTLALPSTADGRLDPAVLSARLRALAEARRVPGRFEAVQALLRLPAGSTDLGRRIAEMAGVPQDEGLLRASQRDHACRPVAVRVVDLPSRFKGYAGSTTVRFDLAEQAPSPRRDDPVGQLAAELGAPDAGELRRGWWSPFASAIPPADRIALGATPVALPNHHEMLEARAASLIAEDMDSNRSSDGLDVIVSAAVDPDAPLTLATHVLLAVGLGAKNQAVAAAATDLVIAASDDGRFDPEQFGSVAAILTSKGVVKPSRLADRMNPAVATPLSADRIRIALSSWISELDEMPRDVHAVLGVLEKACAAAGRGITDTAAQEKLAAASVGSSKRAKAAERLLALEPGDGVELAMTAVARLVERAERWAQSAR